MEIFTLKKVQPYNFGLLISCLNIRWKVFIREDKRKISEEFGFRDITARHYVFFKEKQVVGIGRVIYRKNTAEIGRIAIIKEHRKQGYGRKMVRQIIENVISSGKTKAISLVSAKGLTDFYKEFGFVEKEEVYFGNTPYIKMVKSVRRGPIKKTPKSG